MYISGSGITTTELKVMNFTPKSRLGYKWNVLSNGSISVIDRGSDTDIYEADITTYGTETYINNILDQLDIIEASTGYLTTSGYVTNEHLFGENIDYDTPITTAVTDIGLRKSNSFKGWRLDLTVKALSPAFTGSPVLPVWTNSCINYKYTGSKEYDIKYHESYYGDYFYTNHIDEQHIFKAMFTFTDTELRNLQEWLRRNRGDGFELVFGFFNGVAYPFGPNYNYPYFNVKITDLVQKQKWGLDNWLVELTFIKSMD